MKHFRALYQIARADFLERVRRYSFLLTLGFTLYLGYLAGVGRMVLKLGEYRGIFNSAWTGSLMALVCTSFLTLVGFYIVKNTIERDRESGVGQILAATPLSNTLYCLGKALSNFLVLASMVALLVPAGIVTQLVRGEDRHIHLWRLLSPFVVLALPAMAFVAALAVLFETIPGLRGGFGNIFYFFFWSALPGISISQHSPGFDIWGFQAVWDSAGAVAREQTSNYKRDFGMSFNIGGSTLPPISHAFRWEGVQWSEAFLVSRVIWVLAAVGLTLLAAVFFNRFDPAKGRRSSEVREAEPAAVPEARENHGGVAAAHHLSALPSGAQGKAGFGQMVAAELRLMLKGQKWWWYLVALGLFVASLASPLAVSRGKLLAFAWVWPILIWSAMGTREKRCQTNQLVFSAAHSIRHQLPALWLAGVMVAMAAGGGTAIRLLIAGEGRAVMGWLVGALFIPTLALACGAWSGSSKLFEILYTVLWYIGPMQPTPQLDFMAVSPKTIEMAMPRIFLLVTLVLIVLATIARRRQLQS
jgi:hypothetical protein